MGELTLAAKPSRVLPLSIYYSLCKSILDACWQFHHYRGLRVHTRGQEHNTGRRQNVIRLECVI